MPTTVKPPRRPRQGVANQLQSLKRQRSVAQADDAQPLEFAYRCYRDYSEWDGGAYEVIERHRIVKRTKKRVYVEDEPYDGRRPPSGEWWDYDQPTFILDRRVFETTGKADRSRKGWWTYYVDPDLYHVERGRMARPACFEALDLPSDASMAQIKAAYHRLSRATHPDAGGADCDFVRLTRNYEKAMLLAAGQE